MRNAAIAVFALSCAAFCAAQSGANWSYEGKTGPIAWGHLDPAYQTCAKGHEQSPIDIRGAKPNKALSPLAFHFITGTMTLENTGRGIAVHVNPGSTLTVDDARYELTEIDFHHPSEHAVKKHLSDMEADLVFRGGDGKTAIVAVRLNESNLPNALLATLWAHLPVSVGAKEKTTEMVNAGGLLPGDRSYWAYTGSELEPPCTEGVRWFVFAQQVSIGRSQWQAFTKLFRVNTRPAQDTHGRKIEASE
jgi:carbonic anhydrase